MIKITAWHGLLSKAVIFLVLFLNFSCITISERKVKNSINDLKPIFDYMEVQENKKDGIYRDVWTKCYRIEDSTYVTKQDECSGTFKDSCLLKTLKKNKVVSVYRGRDKIIITFRSKPYIERVKNVVKYLSDNYTPSEEEIKIGKDIYYYTDPPNSY